ncbi:MAG: glucose-methanol-choline oxidoreductase, partial [Intrasporangiaceae bacterium]|nr:glucose-methanol-choline oxidoreductase [Intrasporangiaceae bacterium]
LTGVAAGTDGHDSLYGADKDPAALLRYLTKKRGPLTSNLGEAIGFVRTRDDPAPDVELICLPVGLQDHGRVRYPEHGITVGAILLRPDSRGSIRLASTDPAVPPIIDPGTFTDGDGDDLRRLSDGLRWCQRLILDTTTLGARITHLIDPAAPLTTDQDVVDHVRRTAQTLYHPVGTCRMGSDPDAVVDPDLRVSGIDALRIADASVMPTLIRGHTNAPAIAIGERASRLVAERARV